MRKSAPDRFIPVAEDTGLIGQLGEQVLSKACSLAAGLPELGIPAVPVSVNLSMHQFRDEGLVATVQRILDESGLESERLELEITESMLMRDEERVVRVLDELHALGVSISVDDFGTGYSSLAYLGRLPVDALKIDRCFVQGITDSEDDAALARAIVSMGHALRLRIVAEGVETGAQRRLLAEWGVDEQQGFLFARPMPAPELAAWYSAWHEA